MHCFRFFTGWQADTELRDTNESLKQLQHINSMLNSLEKQFDKRSEDLELLKMVSVIGLLRASDASLTPLSLPNHSPFTPLSLPSHSRTQNSEEQFLVLIAKRVQEEGKKQLHKRRCTQRRTPPQSNLKRDARTS